MNRILTARTWATVTLASVFVAASYEIKIDDKPLFGVPSLLLAVIAFFLGASLASFLVNAVFNSRSIRRAIMPETWIEGYWFLETANDDGSDNPLTNPGILYLEYKPKRGALKGVTTRLDKAGKQYTVASQVALVTDDEDKMKYLNYFELSYPGPGVRYGVAYAEFCRNQHFEPNPNTLEGRISLEGDGAVRRQSGKRIPDSKVRELQREYKANWITRVLTSRGAEFRDALPEARTTPQQ